MALIRSPAMGKELKRRPLPSALLATPCGVVGVAHRTATPKTAIMSPHTDAMASPITGITFRVPMTKTLRTPKAS